jgi:hypothetical protein
VLLYEIPIESWHVVIILIYDKDSTGEETSISITTAFLRKTVQKDYMQLIFAISS